MRNVGFLTFGHWQAIPHSQVRTGADALLQSVEPRRQPRRSASSSESEDARPRTELFRAAITGSPVARTDPASTASTAPSR